MKVLVSGVAGFIGSCFVRKALEADCEVFVIDKITYAGDISRISDVKNKIKFFQADVADRDSVQKIISEIKPQAVVHWAAETHVDRSILDASPFMITNVIGTQTLLDVSMKNGVEKFINIATDEVYGELGKEGSFYETTPLAPNSPYAVSKTSADMLGRAYFRTFGFPVVTIRPSNNYGPWQFPEKLVPVIILKAYDNQKVPVYARGENIREWLFVEDCADGVLTVLKRGIPGEIYNIGSGQERRNIDVVKRVLSLLGKNEDLIEYVQDRPGHDFRYSLNFDKIKNELDWHPKVNFELGIEKTVNWYLENIEWTNSKIEFLKKYWMEVYK